MDRPTGYAQLAIAIAEINGEVNRLDGGLHFEPK
jgi:hypothetical protein